MKIDKVFNSMSGFLYIYKITEEKKIYHIVIKKTVAD